MAAQEAAAGGVGGGTPQVTTRWRYGDVGDSNFALHGRAVPLLVGLLCAVVFFVALCLYLRWRCHRYAPDDPEAPGDASSSSGGAAAASLPGLDADAIRALPVTLYRLPETPASAPHLAVVPGEAGEAEAGGDDDGQAAEALCSICLGALVGGDKVKVLPPCGHCFHPDCVDAWLRSQPSCPLCRCLLLAAAAAKQADANDAAV